jgi:glycolate dehydrogenase FAD-binding subunit
MGEVLDDLREALGGRTDGVAEAGPADTVCGMPARWVVRPRSTQETSAVLRVATAHDLTVVVRGGGTKLDWGAPPERVDLLLDTTGLDALVEHVAGDLVCVVEAGRTLATLESDLGPSGQRLGVDPARPGTVGGAIATAATGPNRLLYGPVRDQVIGMTLVRSDGVVAHAGGKVVKNVAGYDLGKLLTGSFGTLGVITQVAFRLHPVPAARQWVSVPVSSADGIQDLVLAVVHSQVVPSAFELDWNAGGGTLSLLLEGIPPGVQGRTERALRLLGAGASASQERPAWWGSEPQSGTGALLKVTHEIAALAPLLAALESVAAAVGLVARLRGSPAVGTALVGLDAAADATGATSATDATSDGGALARFVAGLRERSGSFGGTVVLLEAPEPLPHGIDPWGPVTALDLMRSVKNQFDPQRRLAPGRFVGGI